MSMGGGGGGGAVSEINVTPLIDVLLVLLIIFMVIVPVVPKGLDALIPQPPKTKSDDPPDPNTIVVSILSGGPNGVAYKINDTSFNKTDIEPKLLEIFSTRQTKIMFVKGDPDLDFSKVSEVIDYGKQAGVDSIGLITPRVAAGQ